RPRRNIHTVVAGFREIIDVADARAEVERGPLRYGPVEAKVETGAGDEVAYLVVRCEVDVVVVSGTYVNPQIEKNRTQMGAFLAPHRDHFAVGPDGRVEGEVVIQCVLTTHTFAGEQYHRQNPSGFQIGEHHPGTSFPDRGRI